MPSQQIPLIMEIIDNIVSPDDRKRKYTDRQIVKTLIVLQIFNISEWSVLKKYLVFKPFQGEPGW